MIFRHIPDPMAPRNLAAAILNATSREARTAAVQRVPPGLRRWVGIYLTDPRYRRALTIPRA
jgi:hypothetical protein